MDELSSMWVPFFFLMTVLSPVLSDPRVSEAHRICGPHIPEAIFDHIKSAKGMEVLPELMFSQHFATDIVNTTGTGNPLYMLSQCHRDLSQADCRICISTIYTKLDECHASLSARIFLDGCFTRYDIYRFFNESVDSLKDTSNCSSPLGSVDATSRPKFGESVGYAVGNVTKMAILNASEGFGAAKVRGVYALGQCWNTLSIEECRICLEKAGDEVRRCLPSKEGRSLNAGCYLRYSTENFYNGTEEAKEPNSTGLPVNGIIAAVSLAAFAFILLSAISAFAIFKRIAKSRKENFQLHQISIGIGKSGLNFKYETLEKATRNFSISRKLGQGGTGSVYKGTLPNGQTVAVKRLVYNTKQWVDEFFNEVNLISGIHHKNLVKLLGCSIEGPESLLVYEYVANRSLDRYIFDKGMIQTLNWKQRFNIIVGTAEGLAHLHGGCEVRIIHRDIKSSNVLLDENLNPKIADFGLARCFETNMSHLSTGIAGTLGYMAPEYVVRGKLTEKADVYSFGVLVLEIVCGRRNIAFIGNTAGSLLQIVWKLYKHNSLWEALDPSLEGNLAKEEAARVLKIGLMCTQASAADRPSMHQVLEMLMNGDSETPEPNQPPFLMARAMNQCTDSLVLNAAKLDISCTSSEYSPTGLYCLNGQRAGEDLARY